MYLNLIEQKCNAFSESDDVTVHGVQESCFPACDELSPEDEISDDVHVSGIFNKYTININTSDILSTDRI